MSLPASFPALRRFSWSETGALLLLIWAVAVFSLVAGFGANSLSPDDAMRMVQVRDLLAGQSWFDLTQYRLDPPGGVVTHWSRLVDLPLALLIAAGKTLLPERLAEQMAMAVWPTLLLLLFLAGSMRLGRELGGETAARVALLFAVVMGPVLQHFRLGSIHHHNIQLTLVIWSLVFFVRATQRPRDAAVCGILCAASVALGQEMVPAITTLAIVAVLRWIVTGERCASATLAYALSLAGGTMALAALTIAPSNYFIVHCDAISIAQVSALAIGGGGLALAVLARPTSRPARFGAAAAVALALAVFVGCYAPQCIADPYARLDPRLADLWLSSVSEARNLSATWRDLPQQVPAYFGVPLAALLLGVACCIREKHDARWNWIACTAAQFVFLLISVWQLRGTGAANALAAALFPAALLRLLPARENSPSYFGMGRAALIALFLLNPIALLAFGSGIAHAVGADAVGKRRILTSGAPGTCQNPADYAPLRALAPGRVLAFVDAGPFILMESPHAVFAAPYHRNQAGNLAALEMFLVRPDEARTRMKQHAVSYVAFCPGAPERYQYAALAPDGLAARLGRNDAPVFLEKLPLAGTDLSVYRIRR